MLNKNVIFIVSLVLFLSGCSSIIEPHSSLSSSTVETFYDYQLSTPNQQNIDLSSFTEQLKSADVILIGEWHTHPAVHRFQTDLLRSLYQQNQNVALSMEQFTRDKQTVINQYLNQEIGEQTLITQANAWPNYESDYRPLVEFAKTNQLDVIAANAPKDIVRCIGREGIGYLNKLPADQREWLASSILLEESPYKRHFLASMHHGTEAQNLNQYAAQVTWDETMADSIVEYLSMHSGSQLIHIAGKFHIENGLGTAASILARAPQLNVVIVTPIDVNQTIKSDSTDYQLLVLPPPTRFVKKENMAASFKQLKDRNSDLRCLP